MNFLSQPVKYSIIWFIEGEKFSRNKKKFHQIIIIFQKKAAFAIKK